jgi:hypothetical protein
LHKYLYGCTVLFSQIPRRECGTHITAKAAPASAWERAQVAGPPGTPGEHRSHLWRRHAATAGEHYAEVWNPPEARIGQPAGKGKSKVGKTALLSRGMGKVATRRIADPLAKASAGKHAGGDGARKATSPRFIDIPRILTPEGNVLQVGTGHTSVYVVR